MIEQNKFSQVDLYIAEQMKKRRKVLGISQKELAHSLGVTFQQVQKYESGTNRVSAGKLYQIAQVLETTVGYFFSGFNSSTDDAQFLHEDPAEYTSSPLTDEEVASRKEIKSLETHYKKIRNPKLKHSILNLVRQMSQ